ncbi:MAG: M28 family peptidase [Bacteroidales bacterium]|nr:M28 family peptidase [Bacteroidales bacterium]
MKHIFALILALISLSCCTTGQSSKPVASTQSVVRVAPDFNADSAYVYVEKQSLFGPRVPNTKAHDDCANYLSSELKRFGATVIEQKATLTNFDGTKLKACNIIGSYNIEKPDRILLLSHWDSRPFADNDPNKANHKTPVLGVDDGASGVGVLLEVARMISIKKPNIGIDILFVDAEDTGAPYFFKGNQSEDDWCLGTQYWAKNLHIPGYKARFGILLDMVGAGNAMFYKDAVSVEYAGSVTDKVWATGQTIGYGQYFKNGQGGYITDDHVYVNRLANIPCVDIINYDPQSRQGFPAHWHTLDDTMRNIAKPALKAVGQTIAEVVYSEK